MAVRVCMIRLVDTMTANLVAFHKKHDEDVQPT